MLTMRKAPAEDSTTIMAGGETFADSDELVDRARELALRGAPFVQAETAVIGATWPYVVARSIQDTADVLLIPLAQRFYRERQPVTPAVPTPFDETLAKRQEELAVRKAQYDAANDALFEAVDAERRAHNKVLSAHEREKLATMRQNAEDDLRAADLAWLRVRSAVTALEMSASRWRMEQDSYVVGADGKPVKLSEFKG